ncbi:Auxin-responsive protein [Quillaja saponaria]|uniref:Auxin-induced protein n=1 Tax=Quillaja saponaria TaxID=32244 RepID=A0AAD7LRN5_QUISA|nr:Auxin-responsive protein [Quillaja saponaria]
MEARSRNEVSPQLLDLIPKDRDWSMNRDEGRGSHKSSEERKLELTLGPPGEYWVMKDSIKTFTRGKDESLLSLGYFSPMVSNSTNGCLAQTIPTSDNPAGAILSCPWTSSGNHGKTQNNQQQTKAPSFLQFPSSSQNMPVMAKESSQPCCTKMADLKNAEKKTFSPPTANTAVPNSSQKRTAPAPVVGWPPIRSFRKNLASSSASKSNPDQSSDKVAGKKPVDNCSKGLFVKINMDGVPIGRKVDLNAYHSYEKLSSAVDELFKGLLAAQKDSSAGGIQNKQEVEKPITGLLDGSGEYTLVYEDNEGDRMLVGDVPWHMFVSTVKRLRVLKSSELPALSLGSKQDKIVLDSALK